MAFHISATAVRGTSHRRSHAPCQDAAAVALRSAGCGESAGLSKSRQIVVGAVADGGGSRVLSHIGARLSVSLARASMSSSWTAQRLNGVSPDDLHVYWQTLFEDCRAAIVLEAESRSQFALRPIDPGAFACTLIAFMATRDRLAAAQVGDGFLVYGRVVEHESGIVSTTSYELMFQNRETEEASQVVWITAPNWDHDLRTGVVDGPLDMVMASSDGIENVVLAASGYSPTQLQPHGRFFSKLKSELQGDIATTAGLEDQPNENLDRRLHQILSDPEFDKWVDDDKSAALALWVGRAVLSTTSWKG